MNFRINKKAASMFLVILPVATVFNITGCGSDDTTSVETKTAAVKTGTVKTRKIDTNTVNTGTVTVTESDAGSTVRLAVGAKLDVILKSNPSTGYHWIASVDQICLQQSGEPVYTPDAGSEDMIGAGGTEIFTFEALAEGETELKMDYLGPDNQPSSTTYVLTVKVQEDKPSM